MWEGNWLPEVHAVEAFERWRAKGIQRLADLLSPIGLKTFDEICQQFDLPRQDFYKFL